jgi:Domain of Unknown Function (DUF1907)
MSNLILVLKNGLKSNFSQVQVEIVDCPDLSQAPFHLASTGLGPPYLLPLVDKTKVYDLVPLLRNIQGYHQKEFFTADAGAGPFPLFDQNCEGIINLKVGCDNKTLTNETRVVRTLYRQTIELSKVPKNETRAALLGNAFMKRQFFFNILFYNSIE